MGKKSGGSSTQTTALDPTTQGYANQMWNAAQAYGNAPGVGVDPATQQALAGYQDIAQRGNLGFGALSGNAADVQQLMSPYQGQVIDQMNAQYGRDQQTTMNGVNDAATAANAFGGSRHGVAEGVALGQLGQGHEQQMAQLMNQGYSDAMGRAGTLANMGFGATGAMGNLGAYMQSINAANDPAARRMQALTAAMGAMPHGSVTTTTQQNGHNGMSGALGGAATGGEIGAHFGPWGAGIGAGIGGLMGLFS